MCRTEQAERDIKNGTVRTRQAEQDSQNRTVRTGQSEQDKQINHQRHAAWRSSIYMQHWHAPWTCSKDSSNDMQHEYAVWTCSMDMQRGHAACTWSKDMKHALQKKPSPYSDAGTGWRRTKWLGWWKMFSTYLSDFSYMLCHPCRKNPTVFYIWVGKFRQCREIPTVFYIQVGKYRQYSLYREENSDSVLHPRRKIPTVLYSWIVYHPWTQMYNSKMTQSDCPCILYINVYRAILMSGFYRQ